MKRCTSLERKENIWQIAFVEVDQIRTESLHNVEATPDVRSRGFFTSGFFHRIESRQGVVT